MSMVEKFLERKHDLKKRIDDVKEAALKAAVDKADEMVDNFIEGFKVMIEEASDAEFIEFITSGKLEDDEINAALMFRAKAKRCHNANENKDDSAERNVIPVHVIVVGEI